MKYDSIILGGGPGGYVAAIRMAQYGLQVALVEADAIGGTCLNRGCIPTKTLLHTAEALTEAGHTAGVLSKEMALDWPALRARKVEVSDTLRGGIESLLKANGVTVLRGQGFVTGAQSVRVTLSDGSVQDLEGENLVIATGSRPVVPRIPGAQGKGVYTSDSLLETMPELKRLTIIGGGVIGMEFASIYQAFGTEVTVIEAMERILPPLDKELSQNLSMICKKRGIRILTGAMVQEIMPDLTCRYSQKDQVQEVAADGVLIAIGRAPNTAGLFDENCMPEMERGRIQVDAVGQTSVPHIYAIGDCANGGVQLAHAASAQGLAVAAHLAGKPCEIDLQLVPSCVYVSPEIASVGLTEAEAKAKGIPVQTGKFLMGANGKSLLTNQERGFVKLVADESGRVLGAQLMCGRATDMIGELTLAIASQLTVEQIASAIHPHPTFAEGIAEAADTLLGYPIHTAPRAKRSGN